MKFKIRKGMILTLILLSIGIIGAVFFFPMNINNQYTCLYHRIFALEHHRDLSSQSQSIEIVTPEEKKHEHDTHEMVHSELLEKYILPFGLIWWMSLITIALAFWGLKRGPQKDISNIKVRKTLK